MREVTNTKPIEIHALMAFLCNEVLCFDVSERKCVCQEIKGNKGENKTKAMNESPTPSIQGEPSNKTQ